MKTKHIVILLSILPLMSIATAKEEKTKADKKEISPEILEKYDTDKDGKLSKEERSAMKADKEKEKKPKKENQAEDKEAGDE